MTTFMLGNEGSIQFVQGITYMFWTDDLLICHQHARGMRLQPFTRYDREQGFGKLGCPFCPNGQLHGTFSQYRSQRAVKQALDTIAEEQAK